MDNTQEKQPTHWDNARVGPVPQALHIIASGIKTGY